MAKQKDMLMLKTMKAIVLNPWNVNLYRMGQVFKFHHMVYEKYIMWIEDKIMK